MTARTSPSERDYEQLSAYLDDALSPSERADLEQRLTAEPELRRALDDLRSTVHLLHALPPLKAPRDFRLDPAVYGRARPWWQRLFEAGAVLQLSGALGTAASIMLIAAALLLGSGDEAALDKAAPAAEAPTVVGFAREVEAPTAPRVTATAPPPAEAAGLYDGEASIAEDGGDLPTFSAGEPIEVPEGAADTALGTPAVPDTTEGLRSFGAESDAAGAGMAAPSSPLPEAQAAAPLMDSMESAESADEAGEPSILIAPQADQLRGAAPTGTVTATPPPTATPPEVALQLRAQTEEEAPAPAPGAIGAEDDMDVDVEEAQAEVSEEGGPVWWLAGLGVVGLVLSAGAWIAGRRRAARR